jgi:hypothetical protein
MADPHNVTMTVTNLTAYTINTPIVGGNGVSPDAAGGSKFKPLPYPFSHVVLGPNGGGSDAKTLPIHMEDFRHMSVPWLPLEPSREWAMLIQAGVVSVTFSHDAVVTKNAEDLANAINAVQS